MFKRINLTMATVMNWCGVGALLVLVLLDCLRGKQLAIAPIVLGCTATALIATSLLLTQEG